MRARSRPARSRAAGQAIDYLRFLRTKVPGFENAYALDIAPQLGIRETRRLVGEATLTADDVLGCADFADTIGVNGWPLELHVGRRRRVALAADPRVARLQPAALSHAAAARRETAGGIDNVLAAGRCASMTHEGHSAARVSGACFVMGQAAGTAAALALRSAHAAPRSVAGRPWQDALQIRRCLPRSRRTSPLA